MFVSFSGKKQVRKAVVVAMLFVLIFASAFLGFVTTNISKDAANAFTSTYTQNNGYVKSVDTATNPLIYTQDNPLTLLGGGGNIFGDFASEGPQNPVFTNDPNNYIRINEYSNMKLVAYIGIDSDSDFADAILDDLVNVEIETFFVYATPTYNDGYDTCECTITYYSGKKDAVTGEYISYSDKKTFVFGQEDTNDPSAKKTAARLTLPSEFVDPVNAYLKIELSNFVTVGARFSIGIKNMGFAVKYSTVTNVAIEDNGSYIENLNDGRNIDAASNMVKIGDVICINTAVQKGAQKLVLNQTNNSTGSVSAGKFYRKLFLTSSANTRTIIDYEFSPNLLERVYFYDSPSGNPNITSNYSGEKAYFRVLTSTATSIKITAKLWRYDLEPMGILSEFNYNLDGEAANVPQFDATSDFYQKYIEHENRKYFTNKNTYKYEDVTQGDGTVKSMIYGVDLSLSDVKPVLSSTSLQLKGGQPSSDQLTYYKVRRLADDEEIPTWGQGSSGFNKNEADGVYCTVLSSGQVIYSSLIVPLKQNVDGEIVYHTSGSYAIELTTYDLVGNIAVGNVVYFVKVDVADYVFTYSYRLGDDSSVDKQVSKSDVTLLFATIADNGVFSSYVTDPTFKRGDKVSVIARFNQTSYNTFILTAFSATNVNISTTTDATTDLLEGYQLRIKQASAPYTFEVDTNFSNYPETRHLTLKFKQKVTIDVTNTIHVYDGNPKAIKAQINTGGSGGVVAGINVAISYSKDNITFTTTPPTEAGVYYYKCELINHTRYYGNRTGTFEVAQASPNINGVVIDAVDYGNSLSTVDFDDDVYESTNGLSQKMSTFITCYNAVDNRYVYYKSADGIVGYYYINMEKNSQNYIKPSAGTLTISVHFRAIKYTVGVGGSIIFTTTPEGVFVHDNNYKTVSATITINIRHSTNVDFVVPNLNENEELVHEYDGSIKPLSYTLQSTLTGEVGLNLVEFVTVKYANITTNENNRDFVLDVPINAGRYLVQVQINSSRCNYLGTFIQELVITKKKLNVTANNLTCIYQAESNPTAEASLGEGINKVIYNGIKFAYVYYYYNEALGTLEQMAVEGNLVEQHLLFDKVPVNAGKYLVKVIIDELNYESFITTYATLTINKVIIGNSRLSITFPTLGYTANNRNSHITYLQPLSQVVINNDGKVQYNYHVYVNDRLESQAQNVAGRFIVVYRKFTGLDLLGNAQTAEQYLAEMESYDQSTTGSKLMYMCFVASEENFKNFDFLYIEREIIVGKAVPNFGNVTIADIIYGTTITNIADIDISYAVRIHKTGSGSTTTYYQLPFEHQTLGYTLSLANINSQNPKMYDVGSHYIDISFVPNDTDSFETLTYSVEINVHKLILDITFDTVKFDAVTGYYTYTYRGYTNPTVIFGNKVDENHQITGAFSYYFYPSGLICTDTYLNVAEYTVKYKVNHANYDGEATFLCRIEKDTLIPSLAPNIFEEATAVSYNKLLKDVTFNGGIMRAKNTNQEISGTYKLLASEDQRFVNTGEREQYSLYFIPNDSQNYFGYGEDGSYKIYLTVQKADISTGISVSIPSYIYGELDYNFAHESVVSYATSIWTDGTNYASSKLDGSYHYLAVTYAFANIPTSGKVGAGSYRATVTINDANYKGSAISNLVINKKQAFITVVENVKVFSNKAQTITAKVTDGDGNVLAENIAQSFYKNGIVTDSMPSDIGKYDAKLALSSNNYFAQDVITTFTIKVDVSQISITNTEQVYTIKKELGVSLGLNEAIYSLSYYDAENNQIYYAIPTNVGEYIIRLNFLAEHNDGYEEMVHYSIPLKINKYLAKIIVSDIVNINYTNRTYTINYHTEPYGLVVEKLYLVQGEEDYQSQEVFKVGAHRVKLTIEDANYRGEIVVLYNILPANLTITTAPQFGQYVYNSDTKPALLVSGKVDFGTTEQNIEGTFDIDLSDIRYLNVGRHSVKYTFTATTDGQVNANYKPIQGQTTLTIIKKTIDAEFINIGTVSGFYANYDGKYHGVDAFLSEDIIYDINGINSDLTLRILYNGITVLPRDKGEYLVRVEVVSKNYAGEKIAQSMYVVDFGIPQIREKPSIINDNFSIGDTITTANIMGGKAYLVDTNTIINGQFVVISTTFEKANINKVSIKFVPDNSSLYDIVTFDIDVNVKGTDSLSGVINNGDWTDQIISVNHQGIDYGTIKLVATANVSNIYGVRASDFEISFQTISTNHSDPKAYLATFGLLSFVDKDKIVGVGEKVKVKFVPAGDNADIYNIMYGYIDLQIQKAQLASQGQVSCSLKGFLGKDLQQANRVFSLFVNGNAINLDGELYLYEDSDYQNLLTMTNITKNDSQKTIYIKFVTNNYEDIYLTVQLQVHEEINSDSIIASSNSKSYDGNALTAQELGIEIINTQLPIDSQDISIKIFDASNNQSLGIEVGTYTVFVYVDNTNYYGSASFVYTVYKSNISSDLTLSNTVTNYGSIVAPSVLLNGQVLSKGYKIYYKERNANENMYSLNLPINAGLYKIKVVMDENQQYEGSKEFNFEINKLEVSVVDVRNYSYEYSKNVAPSIFFKYRDSSDTISLDYEIYYYSSSYTLSTTLPINAGSYKGRIIILDANHTLSLSLGYLEFNYEITQRVVSITTLPTAIALGNIDGVAYNLKYGQKLSEVRLDGGEATRNDIKVDGKFSLRDGMTVLSAGTHTVFVVFTPYDSNYATAEAPISIVIAPADATVIFSVLTAQYNGTPRSSAVVYSVSPISLSVTISFMQKGQVVVPINAGNYEIIVTSNNANYRVTTSQTVDGGSPIFVVSKALPDKGKIINPKANTIAVGEGLNKSTLTSGVDFGLMFYKNFNNPITGNFQFMESSLVFKTAGTYNVDYLFTPQDSNNFATHTGTTTIIVGRARGEIVVSNNIFVYGGGFKIPTFTTFPANLQVQTDITFNEYNINDPSYQYRDEDIIKAGTYYFHAWINDPNYEPILVEFAIIIQKKELDMNFVNENGQIVTQYQTTYGKRVEAKYILYDINNTLGKSGYLLKDQIVNGRKITDVYNIRYISATNDNIYDSHKAPTDRGTYYVSIELVNDNYKAKDTIIYKIDRGVIESIEFDQYTLEQQVYGSVVDPIVTTKPSNVSYYIVYQGSTERPKDAGNYNIMVYFNDNNYDKLQVSALFKIGKKDLDIINVTVSDKVYDGVSSLKISGELKGVLFTDEVSLVMSASTLNNAINVGYHYVEITSYELKGLKESNYTVKKPSYNLQINIKSNKVQAAASSSFITSSSGFNNGTTVEFTKVNTAANKTNIITKAMGTQSTVIGFTIKENGSDIIIKDQFKVYVMIPEEYRSGKIEVKGAGNLAGQISDLKREGDYYTFHASASGQIIFTKSEFEYTFVVTVVAFLVIIVGIVVLFILNPMQKKNKTRSLEMQKATIRKIKRGY